MENKSFKKLLEDYKHELFGNILPFWLKNGIDEKYGGYFTCFSNDGSRLLHEHKFTWSQGRFVWMLARLYRTFEGTIDESGRQHYLELAASGAGFLIEHALLPGGNCAFILDRQGGPILLDNEGKARSAEGGESYDLSIYADFFVIYGLGEYAHASGEKKALDFALDLYRSVKKRLASGNYRTDPYPVPRGYKVHGLPMILLETSQELAEAARSLGFEKKAEALCETAADSVSEIMTNFRRPGDRILLEMIGTDNQPRDNLLGRYINPGHVLEDMWFIMHWALRAQDRRLFAEAAETIRWKLELAWDREYGGLPQFLDRSGEPPRGELPEELQNHEMVKKLRSNWSNKLWWVHSEAIYALLLALDELGESWIADWFWRVHEYTFSTFPNPDKSVGEWIQIRDRAGRPESKVVALPVKDPFHIVRALTLAIPVLERLASKFGS
ncbi:MAG TPA: AGE family epimerase/isomerase [archaeon]|nr:AGE family epimerase/isomerase [archaeon]